MAAVEAVDSASDGSDSVAIVEELTRIRGGELDRAAFMDSIRAAMRELDRCYARAQQRLPKQQGRLVTAGRSIPLGARS